MQSGREEGRNWCYVQLNKEAGSAHVVGTVSVAEPSSDRNHGGGTTNERVFAELSGAGQDARFKDTQAEKDISKHNLFLTDDTD